MARWQKRILGFVEKTQEEIQQRSAKRVFVAILGLGIGAIGASAMLKGELYLRPITEPLTLVGVTLITVAITAIVYDILGGSPEMSAFHLISKENELGSSAQANGISRVYKTRESATHDIMNDILKSSQSCRMYAAVYQKEVIFSPDFADTVSTAVRASRPGGAKYLLSHCSFDPNPSDPHGAALLEVWAKKEGEVNDVSRIRGRIERGVNVLKAVATAIAESPGCSELDFRPRYFLDYPCPHSMIVIDDRIVYISFYDWCKIQGNDAPTLRLKGGRWARNFIKEADRLDAGFSVPAV